MGCFWSRELPTCSICGHEAHRQLVILNNRCEDCRRDYDKASQIRQLPTCSICGREAHRQLVILNNRCEDCRRDYDKASQIRQDLAERNARTTYYQSQSRTVAPEVRPRTTVVAQQRYVPKNVVPQQQTQALYGSYKCRCGRFWDSRLSWPNSYQICKKCKATVHPHTQRPLRPGDMSEDKENVAEHEKELCQMCQQLGRYCGAYKKSGIQATGRKPITSSMW